MNYMGVLQIIWLMAKNHKQRKNIDRNKIDDLKLQKLIYRRPVKFIFEALQQQFKRMAGPQFQQELELPQESYDEGRLETLRETVCMKNSQLLQLTYNNDIFTSKLQEINKLGCECIQREEFQQAIIYLSEAEKVLQYAASCGKTIQRNLIIAILNNEAALYQNIWELDKSANYIQAIIYNLTFYLDSIPSFDINYKNIGPESPKNADFGAYITAEISVATYYLQFCAVSSQSKNHQDALTAAAKTIVLLQKLSLELFYYQQTVKLGNPLHYNFLEELGKGRDIKQLVNNIEEFTREVKRKAVRYLTKQSEASNVPAQVVQQFKNYSIGNLMQLKLMEIKKEEEPISMQEETTYIENIYKAVYISIAYFTMATELRYVAAKKYPSEQQKINPDFKESKVYHLLSIMTAAQYIPCHSTYFNHLINSFKNHYDLDLFNCDLSQSNELHSRKTSHTSEVPSISRHPPQIKETQDKKKEKERNPKQAIDTSQSTLKNKHITNKIVTSNLKKAHPQNNLQESLQRLKGSKEHKKKVKKCKSMKGLKNDKSKGMMGKKSVDPENMMKSISIRKKSKIREEVKPKMPKNKYFLPNHNPHKNHGKGQYHIKIIGPCKSKPKKHLSLDRKKVVKNNTLTLAPQILTDRPYRSKPEDHSVNHLLSFKKTIKKKLRTANTKTQHLQIDKKISSIKKVSPSMELHEENVVKSPTNRSNINKSAKEMVG